jgi:hypothetical protein
MRQRRLFLIRLFAAIAAFFFLSVNLLFPQPTYAFVSSLDTPSGIQIAAYEASTVAAPSVGASSTASATVAETGATVSDSYVGLAFIGLGVTGLAIAGLTAANINSLQTTATQKYCAANADACRILRYKQGGTSCQFAFEKISPGYSISYIQAPDAQCGTVDVWAVNGTPLSRGLEPYEDSLQNVPWSQWSSADRTAATALLSPSDYQQNNTESSTQSLSGDTKDPSLTIVGTGTSGAFVQNSDGSWTYQSSNSFTIPNPNYIPSPTPTPSPSPSPSPSPTPSPTPPPDCDYTINEHHIFFPETNNGIITGFHSTYRADRSAEREEYYWVKEPDYPDANYEPFTAAFGIPEQQSLGTKISSFFPLSLDDSEVLNIIGEAYIKSGCPANGTWVESVGNPLIDGVLITIEGAVRNYVITTAYPYVFGVPND